MQKRSTEGCSKFVKKSVTLCQKFWSDLKIFRMEIKNASTTSSKSNQLRNINSVRWESRNITTQPGEIYYRKSEVIAFVVNACVNITTNNFDVQMQERCLFVRSICLIQLKFSWIYVRNMLSKFRVINGEYIVKISRGIVELVNEVKPFGFLEVLHKIPLVTI